MIKDQIPTRCEHCEGQAYLPDCEDISATGERCTCYEACPHCQGSGKQTQLINLVEFADLLDCATALKPDWAELPRKEPISNFVDDRGSVGTKNLWPNNRGVLQLLGRCGKFVPQPDR